MQGLGPKDEIAAKIRQFAAARQSQPTPFNAPNQANR
jgi:hypothetical protein